MVRGISIAASGLALNQRRLEASAHNTANLTTEERLKLRVRAREAAQGGVEAQVRTAGGEIDLLEERVEQITAAQGFSAGLEVLRTQDRMLGALLDLEA